MNELETVRKVQRLAYEGAIYTRSKLFEGITEREASAIMEDFFIERGHELFFHRPFAWFGDRTGFTGFNRPGFGEHKLLPHLGLEFMPTETTLKPGMAVILDVAPSVNGLAVDIGYSFSFGENLEVTSARKQLLEFRDLILKLVKEKRPVKEIYEKVEHLINDYGYRNCHGLYPLGVLGHRIGKLPLRKMPKVSLMGFHPQAYLYLLKEMVKGVTILTESEPRPLSPGLWAIEPHVGGKNFGVKFEEILVVTENDAYWLDDKLPHVTDLQE